MNKIKFVTKMAEQVNQRIENMINELEQMRRTNLFDDEEIRYLL